MYDKDNNEFTGWTLMKDVCQCVRVVYMCMYGKFLVSMILKQY